jgi:site-specific recombinase
MQNASGHNFEPRGPVGNAVRPTTEMNSLLGLLETFSETRTARLRCAAFVEIAQWTRKQPEASTSGLALLVETLESQPKLRLRVARSFGTMLSEVQSLSLFAEAGLPSVHSFPREIVRRIVGRILPSAIPDSDARKLLRELYRGSEDARRFAETSPGLFTRVEMVFSGGDRLSWDHQRRDLENAMRLLAARICGLGLAPEMRERVGIDGNVIAHSPFYSLVTRTEELIAFGSAPDAPTAHKAWQEVVRGCRAEIEEVRQHMQSAGISVELVFDLNTIQACLSRMENIASVLVVEEPVERGIAVHRLLNRVIEGNLEDVRISSVLHENLNLLARKIVERTGETGEHYIANNRREYRQMWIASVGGGLLTVLTAAVKMRIVEGDPPPFFEAMASGTNYAVSFILLQVFGLVLATKQPASTAATFARIIRDNRGQQRSSKVADFVARITSTQLAAAIGNVIAVCLGAVLFERLWRIFFEQSYLERQSATYVLRTLHPYASATAVFAIVTGVILWLAALIGSWIENAAVYYRTVEALAQHPFVARLGPSKARKLTDYVRHNMGGWFTSVALGYLLGFTPVIGKFFGVSLDVRHVTLSTGTLALATARFGTAQWGRLWVYHAIVGIAIVFVLNLAVSFTIAAYVALRAYSVSPREQWKILQFLTLEACRSPLRFLVPRYETALTSENAERH